MAQCQAVPYREAASGKGRGRGRGSCKRKESAADDDNADDDDDAAVADDDVIQFVCDIFSISDFIRQKLKTSTSLTSSTTFDGYRCGVETSPQLQTPNS